MKEKEKSYQSNSTSNIPITLDYGEDLSTEDEKVWIERFQLYEHDKRILTVDYFQYRSRGSCINPYI